MTCHPDPADPYCTSGIAHNEPWLDFNTIQTWKRLDLIYESVTNDYRRTPPKPVVMAEGAYEDGKEYGFDITPPILRRQAYWTYLFGGHHSYGHNDNWQMLPSWKSSLDRPGAAQMTVVRDIFSRVPWWDLVPDQSIITKGVSEGDTINAAARSGKGDWIMVYASTPCTITLDTRSLTAGRGYTATWLDPRDGSAREETEHAGGRPASFTCPAGIEDGVLLLKTT
jgi:hypothetical protein